MPVILCPMLNRICSENYVERSPARGVSVGTPRCRQRLSRRRGGSEGRMRRETLVRESCTRGRQVMARRQLKASVARRLLPGGSVRREAARGGAAANGRPFCPPLTSCGAPSHRYTDIDRHGCARHMRGERRIGVRENTPRLNVRAARAQRRLYVIFRSVSRRFACSRFFMPACCRALTRYNGSSVSSPGCLLAPRVTCSTGTLLLKCSVVEQRASTVVPR